MYWCRILSTNFLWVQKKHNNCSCRDRASNFSIVSPIHFHCATISLFNVRILIYKDFKILNISCLYKHSRKREHRLIFCLFRYIHYVNTIFTTTPSTYRMVVWKTNIDISRMIQRYNNRVLCLIIMQSFRELNDCQLYSKLLCIYDTICEK